MTKSTNKLGGHHTSVIRVPHYRKAIPKSPELKKIDRAARRLQSRAVAKAQNAAPMLRKTPK